MNESKAPQTLQEAITFFAKPLQTHDFLVDMRWNGNVTCPRCSSDKVGAFSGKRMVSNCKSCKKQFTVKVGTIFEDSPLSLSTWLPAVWMITNAKNGISSYELHRSLGVTQKTAWFMVHRIRLALQNGTIVKLGGEVEADETFIGAKARNMHAKKKSERMQGRKGGSEHLTAVQGLLQRNSAEHSKVILKDVKTVKKHVIQANYVLKGSNLFTDSLASYKGLKDDYNHQMIDHAVQYVDAKIHTNGRDIFWRPPETHLRQRLALRPVLAILMSSPSASTSARTMTVASSRKPLKASSARA